jgi:Alpha/beta hydrolase domain
VTDTQGNHIDLPPEVRVYLLSGAPHGNVWNAVVTRNPACALPLNPVSGGPIGRALLTAMNRWITDGVEPPSSRYPTRAGGTLVPAAEVYPVPVPGLSYRAQYVRAQWIEQTAPVPRVRGDYPLFLPRAGVDGNAIAGIRQPLLAAPRATYTGWNPIAGATGTQELCTQMGGTLPLALTQAERHEAGDPRPSIEELYRAPGDYVATVQVATQRMVTERLLLREDADGAISAALAGTLAKLGR